jgi:hypothetical protein
MINRLWIIVILSNVVFLLLAFNHIPNILRKQTNLKMGLGDLLKNALANDPSLPPAKDPGLSKGPEYVMVEFTRGEMKKKIKAIKGQKVSDVASQAGVDIKYSCKKGECRTCEVTINGKIVKACQSYLPSTPTVQILVPIKK